MRLFLKKANIIRGFKSFEPVLSRGRKFYTDNLFTAVSSNLNETGLDIKVGFIISKKKFVKLTGVTG